MIEQFSGMPLFLTSNSIGCLSADSIFLKLYEELFTCHLLRVFFHCCKISEKTLFTAGSNTSMNHCICGREFRVAKIAIATHDILLHRLNTMMSLCFKTKTDRCLALADSCQNGPSLLFYVLLLRHN